MGCVLGVAGWVGGSADGFEHDGQVVQRLGQRRPVPRGGDRGQVRGGGGDAVASQQLVDDRLDLHLPEVHADALVGSAAEREVAVGVALVLPPALGEPLGVERVGVGPQLRVVMDGQRRDRGRRVEGRGLDRADRRDLVGPRLLHPLYPGSCREKLFYLLYL